ncbi:MAG: hypothetical protein VX438_14830 [Planctomycetota bacterium]|jgi:hypothetical protein|nr:hypothetical protein [Planctomycetota bacterium]
MKSRAIHLGFCAAFLSLLIANLSYGQPPNRSNPRFGGKQKGKGGPGTGGSEALNRIGLKVGSPIPGIKIFDDQGKEFNTASLKGSYTVLSFGCLT